MSELRPAVPCLCPLVCTLTYTCASLGRSLPATPWSPALVVADAAWLGFELWQVRAGSVFDNVLVAGSLAEARAAVEEARPAAARAREAELLREHAEREEAEHRRMRAHVDEMREKQEEATRSGGAIPTTGGGDQPITVTF